MEGWESLPSCESEEALMGGRLDGETVVGGLLAIEGVEEERREE